VSFIATEQQRRSVLTYTQSYTDDQNERVSYAGDTLYRHTALQTGRMSNDRSRSRRGSIFGENRASKLGTSSF
jgi:hypothetical protein